MAKKKQAKRPVDREYAESLLGQYESITGRDWYDIEALMKGGDISATLIFIADHLLNKIASSSESVSDHLGEKLENVWGQVADLNAAAKKSSGQR